MRDSAEKKVVFAFDVDGTLEVGEPQGPVRLELLARIKRDCKESYVGTVGNLEKGREAMKLCKSLYNFRLDFVLPGHPFKPLWLKWLKLLYKPTKAFYVGDEERDERAAKKAGYTYLSPADFLENAERLILFEV